MQTWFNRKTGMVKRSERCPGDGWMWIGPPVPALHLSALPSKVTSSWEPVIYREAGAATLEEHVDALTKRTYISQSIRSESAVGRAMKDPAFLAKEVAKALAAGGRFYNLEHLLQYLPQKERDYIAAQMLVREEKEAKKA